MGEQSTTNRDVRQVIGICGRISIGTGVLLVLLAAALLLIRRPDAVSADLASRAARSFVVVFGLVLTISTATAILSAQSAHSIVKEMRSMQVVQEYVEEARAAVISAERMQDSVFWIQLAIILSALLGIVYSFIVLMIADGGSVLLATIIVMFAVLAAGVGFMLLQLQYASRLVSLFPEPPPIPRNP